PSASAYGAATRKSKPPRRLNLSPGKTCSLPELGSLPATILRTRHYWDACCRSGNTDKQSQMNSCRQTRSSVYTQTYHLSRFRGCANNPDRPDRKSVV